MPDKVAVIGAGALGLMAMKIFKEDGFDVTGYETRPYVGGLWKDSDDSTISVHATTIFNTSKHRAATSDFPISDDADDFPTAAQLHKYLQSYAEHFGLTPLVHLSSRVKSIRREGQRWAVEVEAKNTGVIQVDYFDRVCVATGSFFTPRWPKLEGLDKFHGKVTHSIGFHGPEPFKDENVLILGIHATAQDVTNALSKTAKHVYLAHRSGVTFIPRFLDNGMPFDTTAGIGFFLFQTFMSTWFPATFTWLLDKILSMMSKKAFPDIPKSWKLDPAPSTAVATPVVGDHYYPLMQAGFAESVSAVKQITGPKSVELTDGRVLTDVDSIIYCTGYHFNIPDALIPHVPVSSSPTSIEAEQSGKLETYNPYPYGPDSLGKPPRLYRHIFPVHPDPSINNSIAFLGQAGIPHPGWIQFELNAMAVSQVWLGRSLLPPQKIMLDWIRQRDQWRDSMIAKYQPNENATFYPAFLPFSDHMRWLDETAGTGVYATFEASWLNWRSWKLWWQDREAYDLVVKGIFSPTVFRLCDMGKRKVMDREEWKKMLKWENRRFEEGVKRRAKEMEYQKKMRKENNRMAYTNGSTKKIV